MDKLQELTQKLYNEGLSKGKEEGEALVAKAQQEAEEIVKKAQAEAAAIVEKARKEAQDHKTKVEGDVKMASTQALQATKAGIEGIIVAKAVEPVKEQLSNAAFLKEIITTVAQRFSAQETADLSLILLRSHKRKHRLPGDGIVGESALHSYQTDLRDSLCKGVEEASCQFVGVAPLFIDLGPGMASLKALD